MVSSGTCRYSNRPGSIIGLMLVLPSLLTLACLASAQSPAREKPATVGARPFDHPNRWSRREVAYFETVWGVDSLRVTSVESGQLIRFTYRVVDPERAAVINDKQIEPVLIAPDAHVKLVIPSLEKVGQLRQSSSNPEAGRSYWMAFSNVGRPVKKGDRVNIVIGQFCIEGLLVE